MRNVTKRIFQKTHLYNPVHSLWMHRPILRPLCMNMGYRIVGSEDGLPIPSDYLISQIIIGREISWYLHSGAMMFQSMQYVLQKQGINAEELRMILDFGCGCGRIIRYWKKQNNRGLFGSDYNPESIEWCQRHLGLLAKFTVNSIDPPLDYPDCYFDFIYAVSVFTHMPISMQKAWLYDLWRILKNGSCLLITLHGASRIYELTDEERALFTAGEIIVKEKGTLGSNEYGAYHPMAGFLPLVEHHFQILDFIPQGAPCENQDIYLLKRLPPG